MERDKDMFEHSHNPPSCAGHTIMRFKEFGTGDLPCWVAVPDHHTPGMPPLVAIHGLHRGAKAQATLMAPHAAAVGQTVIAPLFARNDWPHYQQVVRKRRADLALLSLLDDLAVAGACTVDRVELFGYSGGAQFAHRFAMLYPHRVARLTLISAGWYTFPDQAPFPYGLGPADHRRTGWQPRATEDLAAFLHLPIRVLVGTEDNRVDETTRSGRIIDAQQGRTRHERAARWVAAVRDAARTSGVTPDIELIELDGCGHDFRSCLRHPDTVHHLFENPRTLHAQ